MSKRKSRMKPSTICGNKKDIIMDEDIPDDIRAVVLFLPKSVQGECYLRETLKSAFTVEEPFPVREMIPGRMHMRVYKLPISGIWITGETAKLLVCSTYIFFEGTQSRKIPIGSINHMSSKIYNREETVYDFVPMFPDKGVYLEDCSVENEETKEQLLKRIAYEGGKTAHANEKTRLFIERRKIGQENRIREFVNNYFSEYPVEAREQYITNLVAINKMMPYGKFHMDTRVDVNQYPEIPLDVRDKLHPKFYDVQEFVAREYGLPRREIPPELAEKYRELIDTRRELDQQILYKVIATWLDQKIRPFPPELIEKYRNMVAGNSDNMLFSLQYLE